MSKQKKRQRQRAVNAWTVNDVRTIICNPVYAGVGPFPPIVSESEWVQAVAQMMRGDGVEAVLLQMRVELQKTFGSPPDFMTQSDWVDVAKQAVAEHGTETYLRQFLGQVRAAYHGVSAASLMNRVDS